MAADDNDFDIAKKIADLLKPAGRDRQQKILRWVAESLDVAVTSAAPSAAAVADFGRYATGAQVSGRPIDIKSFVDAKAPKSDMQFAAVVAYYYRFEAPSDQRVESISSDILQDAARLASRARLSKPLQTLSNAKNQGYLDNVGRGLFRINSVGENLVAMALPTSETPTSPSGRSRKKKPARKPSPTKSAPRKKAAPTKNRR